MENYIYKGCFQTADIEGESAVFVDGIIYTLPSKDTRVKKLVELGYLTKIKPITNKKGAK